MGAFEVGEFGDCEYWDRRYREEETSHPEGFEWYSGAEEVLGVLHRHSPAAAVLEIGCGSSCLAHRLWEAGHRPVVATDLSSVVIKQCAARVAGDGGPEFRVMDVCAMHEGDESWDVILDKGTLDAIDCAGKTDIAIREVARVLRPAGILLLVSCRDPSVRLPPLQSAFTCVEQIELRADSKQPCPNAYMYCLKKGVAS